jgi:hypothetical protein
MDSGNLAMILMYVIMFGSTYIMWAFAIIISRVGKIVIADSATRVSIIDDELIERGTIVIHCADTRNPPSDGPHWLFHGWWLILLYKRTSPQTDHGGGEPSYVIVSFGPAARYIDDLLKGTSKLVVSSDKNATTVHMRSGENPNPFSSSTTGYEDPAPDEPSGKFLWQSQLAKDVIVAYSDKSRQVRNKNYAGVLISGPSGRGKTTFAYWLAMALKQSGLEPTVAHLKLTAPGVRLSDLIGNPHKDRPVIICVDEFDEAAKHAKKAREKGVGHSLARRKCDLTCTMDRIRDTPHVYFVATMNMPLKKFEKKYPHCAQVGRITCSLQIE